MTFKLVLVNMETTTATNLPSDDLAVQATNEDATSCKRFAIAAVSNIGLHLYACGFIAPCRYAVDRGYWSDDFIKYFYRSSERRSPEINRG